MYRNPGLDMPTRRSRTAANSSATDTHPLRRQVPDATPPFMFSRLFLVTGALLAIIAVAGLVSG